MPIASVVIPTYKRCDLLPKAIDSVIAQTYSNWELIIVDDNEYGSSFEKETEEIVLAYTAQDNRIIYKKNERKGGSAARNAGIEEARGVYIAFLDDDDIWLPEKLSSQIRVFESSKSLGLVYCKVFSFLEEGKAYKRLNQNCYRGYVFDKMLKVNFIPTITAVVKKECFKKTGLFDESLPSRQDHDMFLRLSKDYQFDYVNEYLAGFYAHANRVSRNVEHKEKGWKQFLGKWEEELNKRPTIKKELYASYNYEMGKIYYYNKNYNKARGHFKDTLLLRKLDYKASVMWLLSLLKIGKLLK